jgi:Cu(I)/Ag(I) efflux system membrane fusion protein
MNMRNLMILGAVLVGGVMLGVVGDRLLTVRAESGEAADAEILYWVAPMDPEYRRDQPGQSPMGMDLVPVYAGDEAVDRSTVLISPTVENNIGVRTDLAERGAFVREISTVGYVRPIDELTSVVDVRSEGWIEDLRVAALGDVVAQGDLLFRMYSPEIVTAQSEFLQAVRVGREGLVAAARSRLQALGLNSGQVDSIARRGRTQRVVDIYAPRDGVIIDMGVREGAHVRPGMAVMSIADLSEVWVVADLFESDAQPVLHGLNVHMRSQAQPGRMWHGQVEYLYPTVDPVSRAIPVRIRFENSDGALRLEAFVNLLIEVDPRDDVLTVPSEGVIRTGQSERVILALGDGRYQPAAVTTGPEAAGRVEILSGLTTGERIVVSSQFLIDSEASLQGTTLRMNVADSAVMLPDTASGVGRVVSVMPAHGMIEIDHGRIDAINMPAMSMIYETADGTSLEEIAVGNRVEFTIVQDPSGGWLLTGIWFEPMPVEHEGAHP